MAIYPLPTGPWTTTERQEIRLWLGFPAIFLNQVPRLEMALTTVQSVADGGSSSDDSIQQNLRLTMGQLRVIDCQIAQMNQIAFVQATGTDKTSINPVKAIVMLRSQGRNLIRNLAVPLGLSSVIRDYYAPMTVNANDAGNRFMINELI